MHSASPERGDFISIPSQYDVDVDDLVSRVVFLVHFLRVKFEYSGLLLVVAAAEVCSFRDRRHHPVAADDVRKKIPLLEVLLVLR
jgi:hypothetical protein